MADEIKTAKETTETVEGSTAVTTETETVQTETDESSAEFTDGEGKDSEGTTDEAGAEVKAKQNATENRENARKRREAEMNAKLKAERENTIIEALDGVNPYTDEPMKDSEDVKEYLLMKEIKKNGGDPVADYAKYVKEKARADKTESDKKAEREAFIANDAKEFKKKFPEVDLSALNKDKDFLDYAGDKIGKDPLAKIYSDYQALIKRLQNAQTEKAAQAMANKGATPGALQSTSTGESDFFTADQVKKMSQSEVKKNYEKILESMKKW